MKIWKTLGWFLAVFGAWEMVAPWLLGYGSSPVAGQNIIFGVIWAAFGLWIALTDNGAAVKWLGWLSVLAGAAAFLAPALGGAVGTAAFWNDMLVAFLVMLLGIWAAFNAPNTPAPQPAAHH